jgi:hypothetical protein
MDSAGQSAGIRPQHQALVDLTNKKSGGETGKQPERDDAGHINSLSSQHEFIMGNDNEIVGQEEGEATESEAVQITVIFPDFDQVPLSRTVDEIGKFQLANEFFNPSTAEIAAHSPRYRRRSSTFIDGVHDLPDEKASPMAPAQLYSTMSGRLFHSGRIAIVLVGPPARGKT